MLEDQHPVTVCLFGEISLHGEVKTDSCSKE